MRPITLLLAGMLAACAAPAPQGSGADRAKLAQERAAERERELARECRLARMERRQDPRCAEPASSRNPNTSRLPVELPADLPGDLL